ncbi:MAG: hypothetical protein JWN86_1377 [Planctomycetota bacterium]|nr:hypothetical protein [Planctomycetota bacterium]
MRHAGRLYGLGFRFRADDDARQARRFYGFRSAPALCHRLRVVPVFDEPGELIVQLAEAGSYGLRLLGVEPLSAH